ncbi:hypothetical protein BaRGS_00018177 [Batillaria attramentaria]|uniref:non-specific serine/threonine protein kinase n=1 Tax=Batillaria attramentaria TaxID=370345 RepID=A0ABD0KTR9_9CAEN
MADPLGGVKNRGVIGKGAFGVVYLVENQDGEEFALKVMDWTYADVTDRGVAENELKVLKELSHDNVIVYVDSFIHNGLLYILTEYCAGGDLSGFLDEIGQSVPEDLLLVWLFQMACGLEYMHTMDPCILHRDLKPSNVYFTKEGVIRLGDMGIARMLDNPSMLADTFCGTPPYMSPEALSEKPYNAKTDIWALGCIVVEMATLERAYDASSLFLLRDVVMQARKPLPRPQYGGELDLLVARMLAQDPDDRLSSTELLDQQLLQEVEAHGHTALDLLKKHNLLRCLAFHRRSSPALEEGEDTVHVRTLSASVSNLQQILGDGGEAGTRQGGRPYHHPGHVHSSVQQSKERRQDHKEKDIFGRAGRLEDNVVDHVVKTDHGRSSAVDGCREARANHDELNSVVFRLNAWTRRSGLSRSTLISTLRTVLARVVGEESLDSAVSLAASTSSRADLLRDLQGLLGTDQFQTIGSAIIFLMLMQSTMKYDATT